MPNKNPCCWNVIVSYYDTNVGDFKRKRVGSLVLTPHMLHRAATPSSQWTQNRITILLLPRIKKKVELQRGPQQLELNYKTNKELQCFFKAPAAVGKDKGFTKSDMRLSSWIVVEALHNVTKEADFTKVPVCWGVWIAICFMVDANFLPNSLKENILAYKTKSVNFQSSLLKIIDERLFLRWQHCVTTTSIFYHLRLQASSIQYVHYQIHKISIIK